MFCTILRNGAVQFLLTATTCHDLLGWQISLGWCGFYKKGYIHLRQNIRHSRYYKYYHRCPFITKCSAHSAKNCARLHLLEHFTFYTFSFLSDFRRGRIFFTLFLSKIRTTTIRILFCWKQNCGQIRVFQKLLKTHHLNPLRYTFLYINFDQCSVLFKCWRFLKYNDFLIFIFVCGSGSIVFIALTLKV